MVCRFASCATRVCYAVGCKSQTLSSSVACLLEMSCSSYPSQDGKTFWSFYLQVGCFLFFVVAGPQTHPGGHTRVRAAGEAGCVSKRLQLLGASQARILALARRGGAQGLHAAPVSVNKGNKGSNIFQRG